MILLERGRATKKTGIPRESGDDPHASTGDIIVTRYSPRERG